MGDSDAQPRTEVTASRSTWRGCEVGGLILVVGCTGGQVESRVDSAVSGSRLITAPGAELLSTTVRALAACFACLFILGCTGEPVESLTDSGAGDSVASGDVGEAGADAAEASSDAGCTTVPGNLVQNPSFELAPAGIVTAWKADAKGGVVQRLGGAAHCNAWAEVEIPAASTSAPTYFGQDIVLDTPALKGSHVVATMMLRTLDADLTGTFEIGEVSGPGSPRAVALPADGAWKQVSLEWTLPEDVSTFWVAFVSTSAAARRVGVDQVTLVVTPP